MKYIFLILAFLLGYNSYANSEQIEKKFVAELPNGVTAELVGVAYNKIDKGPKLWWRPDGQILSDEPYSRPNSSTTAIGDYSIREFAVRVGGADDCSNTAFSSFGVCRLEPDIPWDVNENRISDMRSFVCAFNIDQKEDAISFGISTEAWRKVEEWNDLGWHESDYDTVLLPESKNPLILTWPRLKRNAVVLEMVSTDVLEAKRMLMYDDQGQVHEEYPRIFGRGPGLIKEQYWFWGTPLKNIRTFEFQKRPYQWIEFKNVSLEPDYKTNVEVKVLSAKEKESQGLAVSEREKENHGYILNKLSKNTRFPEKGKAKYQLEEYSTRKQTPRILNCEYIFDKSYYKFSIVGEAQGDFNDKEYFDGQRTITWPIRNKAATVRDNRRFNTPIYSLEWAMPKNIIEELLTHEVEFLGSYEINGIPCSMLLSVISSKDKLKVWIAKEPDIFPVRIERLENDNLREVFEFENIKLWNGVVFPEIIKHAYYKSDENVRHIPLGSYTLTIESFTPNIEIESSEFVPDFPPDVSTSKYALDKAQAKEIEPTIPAKYLRSLENIDINFNIEQAKDKMILICFFDIEQRPSRNAILELSKKIQELKEQDIEIIAIHTSKIEREYLDEWTKENNIDFPIGMVKENTGLTKNNWGVRALPWLILTNKEHIVTNEGFSIGELDEKLLSSGD
ncbi:MAG: redoxin domain-containing protein [Sedimentisphaerales bacterium]|nr:redoxin domain-containing protein [Sedimentisphaerales bacterium]